MNLDQPPRHLAPWRYLRNNIGLFLVLAGITLASAAQAIARPFWFDELCTVIVSRLDSMSAVFSSLQSAADTNPPPYYAIARASRWIVPDDHLAYRLPSLIGLILVVWCLYAILSRRVCRTSALAGATFALCTPLAAYGYEARPYGLMVGCIAGAILSLQRIDESRWNALLLACSLALTLSLHYYALFVWPVFIAAEAAVWYLKRRFRAEAWAAILVGTVPLILFAGLLTNLRAYYGNSLWSSAHLSQIFWVHSGLFNLGGYWGFPLVSAITASFGAWAVRRIASSDIKARMRPDSGLTVEEGVMAIMLLWMPAIAISAAKLSHSGIAERYLLPTVLGAALVVGYLCSKLPLAGRSLLLAAVLVAYASSAIGGIIGVFGGGWRSPRQVALQSIESILRQHPESDVPIVISSGLAYLPLAYYSGAQTGRRLHALTDPPSAVAIAGSDSVDLALNVLRRYFPMQVEDYGVFAAAHREFLLVSARRLDRFDYWPGRFTKGGDELTLLGIVGDSRIYRVRLKPSVSPTPQANP